MQLVHEPGLGSDYQVPLHVYSQADASNRALVILPALGLGAKFYRPLAEALVDCFGLVVVMEQRGHGDSSIRPSRRCDYGFADWLTADIPAAVAYASRNSGGKAPVIMGHSLGGHLAAMFVALNPQAVSGLILSACGSPWRKAFSGMNRLMVDFLRRVVIPVSAILGHYPGDKVGFGGREARRLMADWRRLASTNAYAAHGIEQNMDAELANYTGPALVLRYADDPFAPKEAVAAVTKKLKSARLTEHCLTREQLGAPADHNQWARHPMALTTLIKAWLGKVG